MECYEVGVAFLDDEGSEREAEGYVIERVGFLVGNRREDCRRDGELEGWGHVVFQSLKED